MAVEPSQPAHYQLRESDGVHIAHLTDRKILDEEVIQQIEGELIALCERAGWTLKLIIDFGEVEHLSSRALGMLITLNNPIKGHGGKLVLTQIRQQIYEVFQITRLTKVFHIEPTLADAKEAMAKA